MDRKREFFDALGRDRFNECAGHWLQLAVAVAGLLLLAGAITAAFVLAGDACLSGRLDATAVAKAAGGSLAGSLGTLSVPWPLTWLRDAVRELAAARRRYSSFAARARGAARVADFDALLREYEAW